MKKVVALVMTFIVVGLAFDVSSFETRADTMSAGVAETNYLLWTYLDTMFMATAGEQASDTTTNHANKNYNLYRDFISFCNETTENASTVAKIEVATAKYGCVKMKNAIDAFETDGSSALNAKVTNDVTNNFKVISGGGNPSNNDDDNNNYDDNLVYLGSASSTALTTLIGQYLTDLYNGKRGDVSKEVLLDAGEHSEYYFDGNYDVRGNDLYFKGAGRSASACHYQNDSFGTQFDGFSSFKCETEYQPGRDRYALLLDTSHAAWCYDDKSAYPLYNIQLCWWNADENKFSNDLCQYCDKIQRRTNNSAEYGYLGTYGVICIDENFAHNIAGVPVFNNYEDIRNYCETGDLTGCLNYFEPKEKPLPWYDYKLDEISKNLSKITQMLTQLPQITTDMLHGFAVGVTGATAGVGANTDPNVQEESVKKAMEESANKTAKKYYQKTSKKSKEELEKEMKVTPSPTKTPTKKVEQTDATMMVDLHEFFPFCVPYDLVHLIKCFCAEPQTPKFNINIKLPYIGKIDTCLDLSMFDDAARILRILETIGFILALVLVSRNLIRG